MSRSATSVSPDRCTQASRSAHDEVRFPSATLDTIEGEVRVSDVTIHPFAHGVPVHGRVDGEHLRFEDFLRAIGVAKHPHVAWALDEVRWSDVAGTLEPFTLSGDLQLHTGGFTVHDAACDLRPCGRVWGFDRATLRGRATVDADGFEMRGVRGIIPAGEASADRVVIGFHDVLRVDGGRVRLALARASPLASLSLDGELRGQVAVRSRLSDPVVNLEGSVDRFDLDRHPLGDVLSLRGRYQGKVLRFEDVHARKGTSRYDVASVRIAFPAHGRVDVEAIVSARALELRDLLSTVRLDKKPPWPLLGGALREARARLRYVQGGRQDPKEALLAVDLDATQARFRGVSLGSTSLHAEATFGGRASLRAFVRGDVMGSQVHVDRLALEGSSWQGQIALRNLDVAALVRAAKGQPGGDTVAAPSAARAWVSGDLNMSSVDPGDPAHSRATFVPTAVRAILGGQNVRLRPNGSPFVLAGDAITVPMLAFDVGNPGQQPGVATAHASIASLSQSPELDAALAIPPMPLQALVGLVPDLQRAKGTFDLALTAKGPIDAPTLGGWLRASATAATVGWIPSELHDVDIAVAVSPHALTIGHARARLGHGTVDVTGSLTMHGLVPGSADFGVRTKGVRLAIREGHLGDLRCRHARAHRRARAPLGSAARDCGHGRRRRPGTHVQAAARDSSQRHRPRPPCHVGRSPALEPRARRHRFEARAGRSRPIAAPAPGRTAGVRQQGGRVALAGAARPVARRNERPAGARRSAGRHAAGRQGARDPRPLLTSSGLSTPDPRAGIVAATPGEREA